MICFFFCKSAIEAFGCLLYAFANVGGTFLNSQWTVLVGRLLIGLGAGFFRNAPKKKKTHLHLFRFSGSLSIVRGYFADITDNETRTTEMAKVGLVQV